MARYTIFISDLHLSSTAPETTKIFFKFLDEISEKVDALYILGDLFNFWVGDDDRSIFNEQIKNALKKTSGKIPIYLMPGNRDFLLAKVFAKESGCILITDPYKIDLYNKKTLLTHGDILCTSDIRYRIFRKIIRVPYGIKIFLKLPLVPRLWFASKIQKYSAMIRKSKSKEILEAKTEEAKKILDKLSLEQIIHGHIHIAESEELIMEKKTVRRISLGEWYRQGNILIYHSNHNFEFIEIY